MKWIKLCAICMGTTLLLSACSGKNIASQSAEVDLTALSSTMVYAEVYNMVSYPEQYVGKTVKIKGKFRSADGENRMYYSCYIPDATACCQQGLEFRLKKEIPDEDYPEQDTDIIVIGTFSTYEDDELMYVELIDSVMSLADA